jgi:uncharacterized protein (DUF488 family)
VPTAFTIGHSTHEPGAFGALLTRHEVQALVDVRRHPGSRRVPWTNSGEIERSLPVEYLHLPGLGGRRRPAADSLNGFWENDAFRGYADHMASEEFAAAFEQLVQLAGARTAAVMCAEGPWWRCHRRLLADALVVNGFEVCHIDPRGAAEAHRLTEGAVVDGARIVYPPLQARIAEAEVKPVDPDE